MSLGSYGASLGAGSRSIPMLATESHNSVDSERCLSYYPESLGDAQEECVGVHTRAHGHTQDVQKLSLHPTSGFQSTVCVRHPLCVCHLLCALSCSRWCTPPVLTGPMHHQNKESEFSNCFLTQCQACDRARVGIQRYNGLLTSSPCTHESDDGHEKQQVSLRDRWMCCYRGMRVFH